MRTIFITFLLFCFSCNHLIKNEEAKVEDEVSDQKYETNNSKETNTSTINAVDTSNSFNIKTKEDLIGNWVGWFLPDRNSGLIDEKAFDEVGWEAINWYRQNKICISIQKIENSNVEGHSVVAGNNRPFKGKIEEISGGYKIVVEEPGNDKYDGKFVFVGKLFDSKIEGKWTAYQKIEIPVREYALEKKSFFYNKAQQLKKNGVRRFEDWEKKPRKMSKQEEMESDGIGEYYSSATDKIYEINASTAELTKADVENLTKGDLLIIRNMIYARHGYSFKNRPLRVFFDAQEWYIPVHTDIKKDLTEIEKKNIQLLLKYEKNAKEYYDYFGRG